MDRIFGSCSYHFINVTFKENVEVVFLNWTVLDKESICHVVNSKLGQIAPAERFKEMLDGNLWISWHVVQIFFTFR